MNVKRIMKTLFLAILMIGITASAAEKNKALEAAKTVALYTV